MVNGGLTILIRVNGQAISGCQGSEMCITLSKTQHKHIALFLVGCDSENVL